MPLRRSDQQIGRTLTRDVDLAIGGLWRGGWGTRAARKLLDLLGWPGHGKANPRPMKRPTGAEGG